MIGAGHVRKNLKKIFSDEVELKGTALVSKKGKKERVPVAVAENRARYSLPEVDKIVRGVIEYNRHYGGLEKGMTEKDITRALLVDSVEHSYSLDMGNYAMASIFVASIVSFGLLIFANDVPTGAVIGNGLTGVTLKLVVALVVVAFGFFLFKIIKNKK